MVAGVRVGWSSLNFDLEGRDREMLEGLKQMFYFGIAFKI